VVCPQNAKEITSEREKVKVMLQSGNDVFVSLAPSFVANFETGIDAMREALMKLGFKGVEETAIGATIVKREYDRLLNEEKRDVVISSCCHSINLLIQKYFPSVLPCLADVMSPMQAHCSKLKKEHAGAYTVFIGPCVSKKDEAAAYDGIVDAVLTFEELSEWLNDEHIEVKSEKDSAEESKARFFPTTGGILKTMQLDAKDYAYFAIDGVESCIGVLKEIEKGNVHKCFIEMSACVGSCIGGPAMEKRMLLKDYAAVSNYAGSKDFNVAQPSAFDIRKHFPVIDRHSVQPAEYEISAVLRQMGKNKKEDELNCGSCGYNTCREKAIAILQGKAEISMCLPFLKEKAESFSDSIVNNTPNGIIVLNDKLEVQQINRAAMQITNLRSEMDILGEQVVRILNPQVFMQVLQTGRGVHNQRVYLIEYKKYVEQTVVLDAASKLVICIMRDVTDEENERGKKEELNRQTVEVADKVVDKQMRIVQEIASLLGETAAETKIALTKLKDSIQNE